MNSSMMKAMRLCALGCLILLMRNISDAAEMTMTAGVWGNRDQPYRLSDAREEELARSLRRITGLQGICFAEGGALSLGDDRASEPGSSLARQILLCALGSGNVFIIEDHSGSPVVNFGQMDQGTKYEDMKSQQRMDIWRVRLDFNDFREMAAPREVRASFDVGFTMLHELLHGLGYKDAETENEIGECEKLINQARAELGLPLRDQYFGESLPLSPYHTSVRLRFRSEKRSRRRLQYLFFLLPMGSGPWQSEEGMSMFNCRPKR